MSPRPPISTPPTASLHRYYDFFGTRNDWDSALVNPPSPEHPMTNKDFRPAYCVLTKRSGTADLCSYTTGG
jgi:hypothetical protein